MTYVVEVLREVWRITKRRDGAIYKTEYTGQDVWIPVGEANRGGPDPDHVYASKSHKYGGKTIRSRKVKEV